MYDNSKLQNFTSSFLEYFKTIRKILKCLKTYRTLTVLYFKTLKYITTSGNDYVW